MAKATAMCKCEKCGKAFTKVKICRNRKEADNWEVWAKENIVVCPECYQAKKEENLSSTHIIREMKYAEYKENYFDCKTVSGSYNKKTKTIKVYIPKEEATGEDLEKMSNSEIFKYAHFLAKRTIQTGDNYQATFSVCLRAIYEVIREAKEVQK